MITVTIVASRINRSNPTALIRQKEAEKVFLMLLQKGKVRQKSIYQSLSNPKLTQFFLTETVGDTIARSKGKDRLFFFVLIKIANQTRVDTNRCKFLPP